MIKTLQIGLSWPSERAGGLPRYYHELWRSSGGVFDFTGMVLGSPAVAEESQGDVVSFASPKHNLWAQYAGARRAFIGLQARQKPNLVASHFALTAFPVRKRIDVPHVVHFHGPWAEEARIAGQAKLRAKVKYVVEQQVYSRANRAIVLSDAFATILARDYAFPRRRIDVIPAGVDTTRFSTTVSRSEARLRLGWHQDTFIVLSVRRLTPRMGLDVLINAASLLKKRARDVEVKIAGTGPLQGELLQLIQARALKKHVSMLGHVSDELLPLAYKAADVTVVPSTALEGFGMVVLESLASGTPVIASNLGGLPEILMPFSPQLLVEPNNPQQLASTIEEAMLGLHLPSAVQCQNYADQFHWSKITQRIRASYERALA